MTGCEFGNVLFVPFPFTDQSTTKRRPAVVVSSATYHRERPDLVILAITSQAHAPRPPSARPSSRSGRRRVCSGPR